MKYRLIHWLSKLGLLNELDYTPPVSETEQPHAYERYRTFRPSRDNKLENRIPVGECCSRCHGGWRHKVHTPPFAMDDTRTASVEFTGGPHIFVARVDGYCQECGGGKFWGLHMRDIPTVDYDNLWRQLQAERVRPLGDH